MHFFAISVLPQMFGAIHDFGISGRAFKRGLACLHCIDVRDFAQGNYRRVDDRPFGGGVGMVMMAEPLHKAIVYAKAQAKTFGLKKCPVVYLSPQGICFDESRTQACLDFDGMILLCGRYEGVDERIIMRHVDFSLSIGDYVLSGGELAAMVVIDALVRRLDGAIIADSHAQDSFVDGLLDCPHYTRPVEFDGIKVPDILLSGDHAKIDAWRHAQKVERTQRLRPDLWRAYMQKAVHKE